MVEVKDILHFIVIDSLCYTVVKKKNALLYQTIHHYGTLVNIFHQKIGNLGTLTVMTKNFDSIISALKHFYPNFMSDTHEVFEITKTNLKKMIDTSNILNFYGIAIHDNINYYKYAYTDKHSNFDFLCDIKEEINNTITEINNSNKELRDMVKKLNEKFGGKENKHIDDMLKNTYVKTDDVRDNMFFLKKKKYIAMPYIMDTQKLCNSDDLIENECDDTVIRICITI